MRRLLPVLVALSALLPAQQITWIHNPANGRAYGVGPATTTWSAGEALAVSLGGHLATIRNASEQAWIEATFGADLGTHGLWIGLNDLAVEGQWVWSSGTPVTYSNWSPGNPDNGSTNDEDAAHLYGSNGGPDQWKWNDETEWFGNILRPLIELPAPTSPVWHQNVANGRWYSLTSQMSWTSAESLAQQYGGHLATIRNAAENAWIVATFASATECHWIGLNDAQIEGAFVWSSGEPVTFTNWGGGEPTNGMGAEHWVHLGFPWGGPQYYSVWNDAADAATSSGFACRGIIEVASVPAAAFTPFGSGCPGTNGLTPDLVGVATAPPRLGATMQLHASNLPTTLMVVAFVLGLSNTDDVGPPAYSLPFDLGVYGWPGCSQLVSDDAFELTLTSTGQADFFLAVPLRLSLVGYTFHAQSVALYPGGAIAVTSGVTAVVGW